MIRIFLTTFAALSGFAFGSFLNVCLSRWPEGESIVAPRSHCRSCTHTLSWWENLPVLSWIFLRGRCRNCKMSIHWRYPLVELLIGALWALTAWQIHSDVFLYLDKPTVALCATLSVALGTMIFYWILVALAFLDAENLWLPDFLTLPGIALGVVFTITAASLNTENLVHVLAIRVLSILAAAGLILLIRWLYWLIRHKEGIGLGDAKLMALLAAWLGFPRTLLSLTLAVLLGSAVAVVLLILPKSTRNEDETSWALTKLPLGTFLCIGGIISALAGERIIRAYLHWAGL